jgi:hypothetical protein
VERLQAALEYLAKEWRVIRGAPMVFIVLLMLCSGAVFGVTEWHYAGTDESLRASNGNKDSEIDMLKQELQGASPQLAAIQSRREASRSKLLKFYVDAGPMLVIPISKWGNKPPDDSEVKTFLAKEHDWETATSEWLATTLGIAAQSRFLDQTSCPSGFGVNQQWVVADGRYSEALIRLVCLRRNLSNLIETGAYDQ